MSRSHALVLLAATVLLCATAASAGNVLTIKPTTLGCKVVNIKEIAQQLQITNTTKIALAVGTKVSYADNKGQGAGSFKLASALAPGGNVSYGYNGYASTNGQAQIANWNGCQASVLLAPTFIKPNVSQ